MLNVTKELTALARKLGYTGKAPDTVAKAINAITASVGEGGGEGGGGCDCEPGYEMVETELFSETVTTSAVEGHPAPLGTFAYASPIEAPSLTVTFDDSVYTVPVIETPMGNIYGVVSNGGPDFSTYPFLIGSNYDGNTIYTETAGAHTVTVATSILQTSADFTAAVADVSPTELFVATEYVTTWQEVHDAVAAKKLAFVCKKIDDDLFCEPVLFVSGSKYKLTTMKSDGAQFETITYTADTADGPIYAK